MEEVDRILIHSLRSCGTEVPEDIQSIRQFNTELIVEAVVRCLRVINPSLGATLSHVLPPGMSAQFRIGTSLAQACQDLGYSSEVGYQTFLYSSEPDIRALLIFLAEKLPRDSSEDAHQPAGKSALLQREIVATIKQQLSLPWLPLSCRIAALRRSQSSCRLHRFHSQPLSLASDPALKSIPNERKEYWQRYLPSVTSQLPHLPSVAASLLERNTSKLSAVQEWEAEWKSQGLASRLSPEDYRSKKQQRLQKRIQEQLRQCAQLLAENHLPSSSSQDLTDMLRAFNLDGGSDQKKGSRFTRTQRFTYQQDPHTLKEQMQRAAEILPKKDAQDADAEQQEISSLQEQIDSIEQEIRGLSESNKLLQLTIGQVEGEVNDMHQSCEEKANVVRVKKRAVELLPDADNNLDKLQTLVDASAQRMANLIGQWESHQARLSDEYMELNRVQQEQEDESSRWMKDAKDLYEKIQGSADEAKRKEELYKQLLSEYESLPKEVSRAAYTQRILEIVSNIKKQKEEITKILSDTKELQKEINNLTGKVDRTFVVTDELVFKDAKKDEPVRKAYKYLAALHENCSQLIQTIEDTGTILREIRDLEEQIETETTKKTLSNLQKILEDYRAIKQENAQLLARTREA
ncbi:coiled-coil domain-containing protein 22 [Xenopus laevis]|uniref:Coiled-coil domain-containing protein 22 n=1 Tax=Xenopus laevis TaxID=8355 RepID=CCD22_XENLA|nr:coiled-coil domain-containing protein 22 [Xenopus laevis]Q6PA15.1 RecName: Full=Coiled-coil domain-containing protein 22 [Xenopus laevis]AAH60491.1 Ccdc22 protein [Xenopus laevis]